MLRAKILKNSKKHNMLISKFESNAGLIYLESNNKQNGATYSKEYEAFKTFRKMELPITHTKPLCNSINTTSCTE